jgi:hypothetical protein
MISQTPGGHTGWFSSKLLSFAVLSKKDDHIQSHSGSKTAAKYEAV